MLCHGTFYRLPFRQGKLKRLIPTIVRVSIQKTQSNDVHNAQVLGDMKDAEKGIISTAISKESAQPENECEVNSIALLLMRSLHVSFQDLHCYLRSWLLGCIFLNL